MAVLLSRMDLFALATLPAAADEAGGPPPTKFYELRDNLAGEADCCFEACNRGTRAASPDLAPDGDGGGRRLKRRVRCVDGS